MQSASLENKKVVVSIAHSPDADDAFMFYALREHKILENDLKIEHILKDIQTLNKESHSLKYDVQAISFFAYPEVEKEYQLLSCGGSLGYGYGPILISNEKLDFDTVKNNLKKIKIAVPGDKTSAFLLLKLLLKDFDSEVVPFEKIIEKVKSKEFPFGLIIHEGQLTYRKYGLHEVIDLGKWWLGKTNLPVPLGGNVIKRSFDEAYKKKINNLIKKSIAYGLANKDKVIPEVSIYARELGDDHKLVSKFVSMYVNEFTLDYGISGKLAIQKLYQMAYKDKLISKIPTLDFVEDVCQA